MNEMIRRNWAVHLMKNLLAGVALLALGTLAGCSGGGGGSAPPPTLVSIAITPANPTVPVGTSQQFTATGTYSDNSTANLTASVTWASGTPANANINASGLASVPTNAPVGGTSAITATSGVVSGTTTLTVGNPNLLSIAVTPTNSTLLTRQTQQYTASGTMSDGTAATAGQLGAITWASSNTGLATINATGLATVAYAGVGTGTITATSGGVSGSTGLTTVLQQTWVSGSSTVNATGVYGTKGTATATNVPGARRGRVSWTDAAGNLWLFGGFGYGSTATRGYLNDMWKWDGTNWTWVSGSSTVNTAGVYGTQGTTAATNVPGARDTSVTWTDAAGNLWLFGGFGYGSTATQGYLNDLWKWDGTNWTWVSGSSTVDAAGVYGTKGTAAATNVPGARRGNVSWIDAAGNLWLFGGYGYDSAGTLDNLNDLWKWNGTQWTWVSGSNTINATGVYGTKGTAAATNVPGARGYSISWKDPAGNLWLFGGGVAGIISLGTLNDLWKWDGTNWTWVSGSSTVNATGVYGTKGTAAATNVPGGRSSSSAWYDGSNLWLFGGYGYGSTATLGYMNDLWKWDGTNWTWVNDSSLVNAAGVYGTMGTAAAANQMGTRASSISWADAAGNLWLFGGFGYDSTQTQGYMNDLWKLSP